MKIEHAITIAKQILTDNADEANTRYRMLSEDEVDAINLLIENR